MMFLFSDLYVTVSPNDTLTMAGQNISLSCTFCSNIQNVTVKWMQENMTVSSKKDSRVKITQISSTNFLTITNIQANDAGEYRCKARSLETGLFDVSSPGQVSVHCKCVVYFIG